MSNASDERCDESNAHTPLHPESEAPKLWKLGDPYQYPIPEPDGNHWEALLKPILNKDKLRCDAWRDEVQNLLIFAGLFSAIVTAFVVQSSQNLQPDPSNEIILLLSRIAQGIENPTNNNSSSISSVAQIPLMPNSSTIRINIFWFMSLILSLTAALIGIVAIQWLREHQAYSGLSPRQSFAIFHMRAEGLEKWFVPHFFTALPLLLQGSLVLFLAGIADYLLALDLRVAIPIITMIGLTLAFLIVTTVTPAFQGFTLYLPWLQINGRVPAQCPYKSPQSRAFCRMVTFSYTIFRFTAYAFAAVYSFVIRVPLVIAFIRRLSIRRSQKRFNIPPPLATSFNTFENWKELAWREFDLAWLVTRNTYSQCFHVDSHSEYLRHPTFWKIDDPLYDFVRGLQEVFYTHYDDFFKGDEIEAAFRGYYCLRELSHNIVGLLDARNGGIRNRHLHSLLLEKEEGERSNIFSLSESLNAPDFRMISDENALIFIEILGNRVGLRHFLSHRSELRMRLIGHIYASGQPHTLKMKDAETSNPPPFLFYSSAGWPFRAFGITQQYPIIIRSFFEVVADRHREAKDLVKTFYMHPFLRAFLSDAAANTSYSLRSEHNVRADLELVSTLSFIATSLNDYLDTEAPEQNARPDILFYSAAIYVHDIYQDTEANSNPSVPGMDIILPALRRYKSHIGIGNASLERLLDIPHFANVDWWIFSTLQP